MQILSQFMRSIADYSPKLVKWDDLELANPRLRKDKSALRTLYTFPKVKDKGV